MFSAIYFWVMWCIWRVIIYSFCLISDFYYKGKGKIVPSIKNPLLFRSATSLARQIRERKIRSEDVVQAYIDRIREVEPFINAVAEDRFDAALEEAKAVDSIIKSGKLSPEQLEKDKPLFGIPFTVKVLLTVKGMKSTAGSMLFKDVIADSDAPSVSLVKNAGGIVLAISSSAEFGLLAETNNLLYGRTCNPYDTSRTPGGSSGGESALLGAGASVIGLGNDLAGSIRTPAHFTGVFAHKATNGLIPSSGSFPCPPKLSQYFCTGPMCRYVEDLVLMTKLLTVENKSKVNFDAQVDFKKIKICFSTGIKNYMTVPLDKEINGAMQKAIFHFTQTYGATVTELKVPHFNKSNDIVLHLLQADLPNITDILTLGKMKSITLFEITKSLFGLSDLSFGIIFMIFFSKIPLLYRQKLIPYYKQLLEEMKVNFDNLLDENTILIYPTFPLTAPHHYQLLYALLPSLFYTGIFNFLGLPSTVVPLGLNCNGMPYGIQVIGAKNNDPLTLACAVELSNVFGGWIPPGCR